jgi:hypothetical protein
VTSTKITKSQSYGFQFLAKDLHGLKPPMVVKGVAPFVAIKSSVVTSLFEGSSKANANKQL